VSERQLLVVRLLNGAVNVREAQGTRAQDQMQESEKEGPDDGLREPGVRHALAADVGRARSRAAGHPRPAAERAPRCGRRAGVPCTGQLNSKQASKSRKVSASLSILQTSRYSKIMSSHTVPILVLIASQAYGHGWVRSLLPKLDLTFGLFHQCGHSATKQECHRRCCPPVE
jgi:hypothetical protein